MSHGGGGGGHGEQSSEPNLTPLLDMVLQLVMFFMLVANFVMEENSDKVRLPTANQAKPLTANDRHITYLNVDAKGQILVSGTPEPLKTRDQINFHMKNIARNHPLGEQKAGDAVTVIIRADKEAKFILIYDTMLAIRSAGFKKIQLRTQMGS